MQDHPSPKIAMTRIAATERHEVRMLSPALLRSHRAWRARDPWAGGFSIAAWLRFPEGLTEMVQLMLGVRDRERRKSYLVDRCLPNQQTLILLNGIVDLRVTGEVSDMSLYLTGPSENAVWMLDECHIEARQPVVQANRPASSGVRSQRS